MSKISFMKGFFPYIIFPVFGNSNVFFTPFPLPGSGQHAEIAPNIGKIRAGTYGRGLWESDIYSNPAATDESFTSKEELILFPNPAKNNVNVKIPENWKADRVLVEIYDINGKKIEAEYQNSTSFSKNIEHLANGIYVIAISSNSRHFVKRLVKQ